ISPEFDDHVIDEFDRGRLERQNDVTCANRVHDVCKVHDAKRGGRRPRFNTDLGPMYRCEGAFGSDNEFDKIEFSISNELVKIVPTDAPHDLWIATFDFIAIDPYDVCNTSLKTASSYGFFTLHFTQRSPFTRSKDNVHFESVVYRFAIEYRMRSCGIVSLHAADSGAIGGRGIGTK